MEVPQLHAGEEVDSKIPSRLRNLNPALQELNGPVHSSESTAEAEECDC